MIRNQTAWVQEIIEDPERTGSSSSRCPRRCRSARPHELLQQLPKEVKTPVLAIVANRVVDAPRDRDALAALAHATRGARRRRRRRSTPRCSPPSSPTTRPQHLETLRSLGPPTLSVPLLAWDRHDLAATTRIAEALESERR